MKVKMYDGSTAIIHEGASFKSFHVAMQVINCMNASVAAENSKMVDGCEVVKFNRIFQGDE